MEIFCGLEVGHKWAIAQKENAPLFRMRRLYWWEDYECYTVIRVSYAINRCN